METLALHFDFSDDPPPDNPDMARFRHDLSRSLERALTASGTGRWRGGRYARGIVTLFIVVTDPQSALEQVYEVLAAKGLGDSMTVGYSRPGRTA